MRRKSFLTFGMIVYLFVTVHVSVAQSLPEDPTKGSRLFSSKGCARCHALKGEGGKIGPDFGRVDLGNTPLEMVAKLWNHIPSMNVGMERVKMIKPDLTGQEFTEISTYLYFLKFFDEPGDATRGRSIFDEKRCGTCHLLAGKGNEGEPGLDQFPQNITPVFLAQSIWNHGPAMIARMVALGVKWPTFEGTEMMDLLEYIKLNAKGGKEIAFITPGNPREGKRVFAAKGCIKCHAIRGQGGKEAADLGKKAKTFYKSLTQIASSMWNKGPTVLAKMGQTQLGIPKFAPKEMADLIAYLYFLHFIDEPGNPVNGKRIFSEFGCSKCHGFDGKPGELMTLSLSKYQKADSPMEIVAGTWDHSTGIEKAMADKGIPWPRFKRGELADLLEYIRAPKQK
ncbi:MAG TPA: c-type cytochrome [Thermodesulfobacteriota bacterium]|nr:c-type cytochrome [Thermodesulfobacteriota bacterium]